MLSPAATEIHNEVITIIKEAKELSCVEDEQDYSEMIDAIIESASRCKGNEKNFEHG